MPHMPGHAWPQMWLWYAVATAVLAIVAAHALLWLTCWAAGLRVRIGALGWMSLLDVHVSVAPGVEVDVRRIRLELRRPGLVDGRLAVIHIRRPRIQVDLEAVRRRGQAHAPPQDAAAPERDVLEALNKLRRKLWWADATRILGLVDFVVTDLSAEIPAAAALLVGVVFVTTRFQAGPADAQARGARAKARSVTVRVVVQNAWLCSLKRGAAGPSVKDGFEVVAGTELDLFGVMNAPGEKAPPLEKLRLLLKTSKFSIDVARAAAIAASLRQLHSSLPQPSGRQPSGPTRAAWATPKNVNALHELVDEVSINCASVQAYIDGEPFKPLNATAPTKLALRAKGAGLEVRKFDYISPRNTSSATASLQLTLSVLDTTMLVQVGSEERQFVSCPLITTAVRSNVLGHLLNIADQRDPMSTKANIVISSPCIDIDITDVPLLLHNLQIVYRLRHQRAVQVEHAEHSSSLPVPLSLVTGFEANVSVHEPLVRLCFGDLQTKGGKTLRAYAVSMACTHMRADVQHTIEDSPANNSLIANLQVISYRLILAGSPDATLLSMDSLGLRATTNEDMSAGVTIKGSFDALTIDYRDSKGEEVLHILVPLIHNALVVPDKYPKSRSKGAQKHNASRFIADSIPDMIKCISITGRTIKTSFGFVDAEASRVLRGLMSTLDVLRFEYANVEGNLKENGNEKALKRPESIEKLPISEKCHLRSMSLIINRLQIHDLSAKIGKDPSILGIPNASITFETRENVPRILIQSGIINANYSLFAHYSVLLAVVSLMRLSHSFSKMLSPYKEKDHAAEFADKSVAKEKLDICFDAQLKLIRVKAALPQDAELLIEAASLGISRTQGLPVSCRAKSLDVFARSAMIEDSWDSLVIARKLWYRKRANDHYKTHCLTSDALYLRIPHRFVFFKLLESAINAFKASKELNYRELQGSDDYVIAQHPKRPLNMPRIRFKFRHFELSFDDDPFESRLGVIFTTGKHEQRMRLVREQAFETKLAQLREARRRLKDPRSEKSEDDEELLKNMKVSPMQALRALREHQSRSWVLRINSSKAFRVSKIRAMRSAVRLSSSFPAHATPETGGRILQLPMRASLCCVVFDQLKLIFDKPSFPLTDLPKFIYDNGRGQAYDTKYSIYAPMNLRWLMREAVIQVRDYPLPIFNVPSPLASQYDVVYSWDMSSDFVIAEQLPEEEAIRMVDVTIIPKNVGGEECPIFEIQVPRTVNPVKFFGKIEINVDTMASTSLLWGASYQPAISDIMRIFDTFTKPQVDVSEKLGFWDKMRLIFHCSLDVKFRGQGDLALTLKGTRNPYLITDVGAGLQKIWRDNVNLRIACDEDTRELFDVSSDEFLLAVPDFSKHKSLWSQSTASSSSSLYSSARHHSHQDEKLQKIIMKVVGGVKWTGGIMFERVLPDGSRSTEFRPHHDIKLRIPKYCTGPAGSEYDAFRGFRSDFLHCSIAVVCPRNRLDPRSYSDEICMKKEGPGYNTIHLSPRVFSHFFGWWSMFHSALSLPLRTGKLFPSQDASSKQRFGNHLATWKYRLELAPLFLSHVYKFKSPADWENNELSAAGVKARIEYFSIDLHQRKEEAISIMKELHVERKTRHMRIYRAQVDFREVDLRAMTASFKESTAEELHEVQLMNLDANAGVHALLEGSGGFRDSCKLPVEDEEWLDGDDFVELDWTLPQKSPKFEFLPLAYTPRIIYQREAKKPAKTSAKNLDFGEEDSHRCLINKSIDSHTIQADLSQKRVTELEQSIERLEERRAALSRQAYVHKAARIENIINQSREKLKAISSRLDEFRDTSNDPEKQQQDSDGNNFMDASKDFSNRFNAHNLHFKWNNKVRNVLLTYIHQVSQRRGLVYYMSRRAVTFISSLGKSKQDEDNESVSKDAMVKANNKDIENPEGNELLRTLLQDMKSHFDVTDETVDQDEPRGLSSVGNEIVPGAISEEYELYNAYSVALIAPQFQLVSETNPSTAVVMTTQGVNLQVVAVQDKNLGNDEVGGLLQRRFEMAMDKAQFFIANEVDFSDRLQSQYTVPAWGTKKNSCWPPWIPYESVFDFVSVPDAFSRVVDRTTLSGLYIKNNSLRLKSGTNSGISNNADMAHLSSDSLQIMFPRVVISANSAQYYAIYTIATNLLMYSEPIQKERSNRLEQIMLAADFSELSGAPEMVTALQSKIRLLTETKNSLRYRDFNEGDAQVIVALDLEIHELFDELFYLMKSLATAQKKAETRKNETTAAMIWNLMATELIWHVLQEEDKPFIDVGLSHASYQRIDNSDQSNYNTLEIEMLQAINLQENAIFPELLSPYFSEDATIGDARRSKVVRIYWSMLEAIGGIAVVDHFEVNLFPLKIQIEQEVGKKIFDYAFPAEIGSKDETEDGADSSSNTDGNSQADSSSRPSSFENAGARSSTASGKQLQRSSLSAMHRADSSIDESRTSLSLDTDEQSVLRLRKEHKKSRPDDLAQMMSRAGTNMTIVYATLPSVVLCISYKGPKGKNIGDIQDFVFRMPALEYRNKTWSYKDLAMQLRKEVFRAILSHSGALIKDKIIHHKSRRVKARRQLSSYGGFRPLSELVQDEGARFDDASDSLASGNGDGSFARNSFDTGRGSEDQSGSTSAGIGNSLGKHLSHLSQLARSRRGIEDDESEESKFKRARMLLGAKLAQLNS